MDIKKLKELYEELECMIDDNWYLIIKAFPYICECSFDSFGFETENVVIFAQQSYCDSDTIYSVRVSYDAFDSEETFQKYLNKMIEDRFEEIKLQAEKRKELEQTEEYRKYLELKEKFKDF